MKILLLAIDHGKPLLTHKLYDSILQQSNDHVDIDFVVLQNSDRVNHIDYSFLSNDSPQNIKTSLLFLDNLGYFGTARHYLQTINANVYDWVIVCNNDLVLDKRFFENFIKNYKLYANEYLISPSVLEDGVDANPLSAMPYPLWKKLFWDLYYRFFFFAKMYEIIRIPVSKFRQRIQGSASVSEKSETGIYMGYGAIFIINPLFLKIINGLPAKTFLYQEESVICYYCRANGKLPLFTKRLVCYHESHATLSSVSFSKDYEFRKSAWWATRDYL